MVFVVDREYDPIGGLMHAFWRVEGPMMKGTKKEADLRTERIYAHRQAIAIGVAEVLTRRRIEYYEYVDAMIPKVDDWEVIKVFKKFDENFPPASDKSDAFYQTLYDNLLELIKTENLDQRNTAARRALVEEGKLEPTEEDKAFYAEQARQLQEQADRLNKIGGTKVDYLVKGGRTEIEI